MLPALAVKKRNIQKLARHSIGLGSVPSDLSLVTDDLRYQFRKFSEKANGVESLFLTR
jgi:hypothetical protein